MISKILTICYMLALRHGDEESKTESRNRIQDYGRRGWAEGEKTLTELAKHFGIHPAQIADWKQKFFFG